MKRAVLFLMIFVSSAVWGENQEGQQNVYDYYRGWMNPAAGSTVEEQVTVRIKRYMAHLLYPVDMSSFVGPDKDAKFRDLIITLQKQMGVQPTDFLTNAQFDRLATAAKDIDGSGIELMPLKKNVPVEKDIAGAEGTLAGEKIVSPFNAMRLFCSRQTGTCDQAIIYLNLQLTLWPPTTTVYVIKTWTADTVIALTHPLCGGVETLTLYVPTNTLTIMSAGSCADKSLATYTLIDGYEFSQTFFRDKALRARGLVYEPARKFLP